MPPAGTLTDPRGSVAVEEGHAYLSKARESLTSADKPRHDLLSTSASLRRLAFLRGKNL
jgi:hypothetical protein